MISRTPSSESITHTDASSARDDARQQIAAELKTLGLAVHRDVATGVSPEHFRACLSDDGDSLCVLRHRDQNGILQLGVINLACELPNPSAALRAEPVRYPFGLSREPPMGERASLPFAETLRPVRDPVPDGARLLACAFGAASTDRMMDIDVGRKVLGVVLAYPPQAADGREAVWWHVVQGIPHEEVAPTARLCLLKNPAAKLGAGANSILLTSFAAPEDCKPSWQRTLLDGIFLLNRERLDNHGHGGSWPDGATTIHTSKSLASCAHTGFNAAGDLFSISGPHGADIWATRPIQCVGICALPAELDPAMNLHARRVNFGQSPEGQLIAVNFSGLRKMHDPGANGRWADVYRYAQGSGLRPLRHAHAPLHGPAEAFGPTEPVWRSIDFVGAEADVVLAYGSAIYVRRIKDGALTHVSRTLRNEPKVAARGGLVCGMGSQPMFAIYAADGMRLYLPNLGAMRAADDDTPLRGLPTWLHFREYREHPMRALEGLGIKLSPNVLTVVPWSSANGRFVYVVFDHGIVTRFDFAPSEDPGTYREATDGAQDFVEAGPCFVHDPDPEDKLADVMRSYFELRDKRLAEGV